MQSQFYLARARSPVNRVTGKKIMSDPLYFLILLMMAAVVVVLAIGIGGFAKGGVFNAKYSNKMMRLRLLLQFVAVLLILLSIYLHGKGGS